MLKHSKLNGCDVQFLRKEAFGRGIVKIHICKTHNVEICRCGIEWYRHSEYYDSLNQNA